MNRSSRFWRVFSFIFIFSMISTTNNSSNQQPTNNVWFPHNSFAPFFTGPTTNDFNFERQFNYISSSAVYPSRDDWPQISFPPPPNHWIPLTNSKSLTFQKFDSIFFFLIELTLKTTDWTNFILTIESWSTMNSEQTCRLRSFRLHSHLLFDQWKNVHSDLRICYSRELVSFGLGVDSVF